MSRRTATGKVMLILGCPSTHGINKRTGRPYRKWQWVSSNGRDHWAKNAKHRKAWRELACWQARADRVPRFEVPVDIHAVVHRSITGPWDAHNLTPSVKAAIDGLVDAGVIRDDRGEYLRRVTIQAAPERSELDHLVLIVEPAPTSAVAS